VWALVHTKQDKKPLLHIWPGLKRHFQTSSPDKIVSSSLTDLDTKLSGKNNSLHQLKQARGEYLATYSPVLLFFT